MENASKALLMAAGVLIAVLALALIVNMFTSASDLFKTEDDVKQVEQITDFNKQYESYNKKLLRGVEVISVLNKAIDNNNKYKNMLLGSQYDDNYKITVEYIAINELGQKEDAIDQDEYEGIVKPDSQKFTELKRKIFDCKKINYNLQGRINYMLFEEREVNNT